MRSGNHLQVQSDIQLNNYDLRFHFERIYNAVIKDVPDNCYVGNQVLDSNSLSDYFAKKYPNKKYALLFYAHKPFSSRYNKANKAHTSLLLCGIENDKINPNKVINIDGYHFLGYVDILGESELAKAQAQNKIKRRIVICSKIAGENHPIQTPSWENMNCVLFSANFARALLGMISKSNIKVIDDELDSCGNQANLFNSSGLFSHGENDLVSAIINELIVNKIYFRVSGTEIVFSAREALDYHTKVRLGISDNYLASKLSDSKKENDIVPAFIFNEIEELRASLDKEIKGINASCFSFFLSYKAATKKAKYDYLTAMLEAKTLTELIKMASNAKTNKRVMRSVTSSRVKDLINDLVDRPGSIFFRKFTAA